jgi:hypothetical protein
LVAITLRASICSVTFIEPISAAMAAPTRPAATTPVSTGDSSRPTAIATTPPTDDCAPYLMNSWAICTVMTIPVNSMVSATIGANRPPNGHLPQNMPGAASV